MKPSVALRAVVLSALLLLGFFLVWHIATMPVASTQVVNDDYAKLVGGAAAAGQQSAFPTPADFGEKLLEAVADPFYDNGPNDKGIGIQLGYSIWRVLLGFGAAALVAIPLGFLIGMSPLMLRALDPFIQLLKPISPLAWMPLALFVLKDRNVSAVFVIFICSVWPMLMNTAFGVSAVRKDWLDVAKTLELSPLRKALLLFSPLRRQPS